MFKSMNLALITIFLTILILFSNITIANSTIQENKLTIKNIDYFNNNSRNIKDIAEKSIQDEELLGWQLGDQQTNIIASGFTITAICVGISDNVVVLIESTLLDQFTEVRGNNIAEDIQNRIYDPTAVNLGTPKESNDYPGCHAVAIIIVDSSERYIAWSSAYNYGQSNGYEAICIKENVDLVSITTRYLFCVYRNLRNDITDLWFIEGIAALWPNFLGIQTTNRCSDAVMDSIDTSGGQNTALLEFMLSGTALGPISYGISFVFAFYLYEQFGIEFIRAVILDNNLSITQSITKQLPLFNFENLVFKDVFLNFEMALRLNDETYNPKWGFHGLNLNIPTFSQDSASSLPLDYNIQLQHWAGKSHMLSISNPSFNALKYRFNGSSEGDFDVHVIGSSYYNSTNIKKVVSEMTIDPETQDGELIFILPEKASNVFLNIANANGPENGSIIYTVEEYSNLRDSASFQIETFDSGLVGTIDSLEYDDKVFTVTASVDWDLDTKLEDNDLAPHVVLYDADGEFAFNLKTYLTFNDLTEKWEGQLEISDDIKSGDYVIKLFVRGVELDSEESTVTGSSAPSFLFLSLSFAFICLVSVRRRIKF